MGQSRPSLCQCCNASSGTGGDEVSLLPRKRCQEPWSRAPPEIPDWMKALTPAFDSSEVGFFIQVFGPIQLGFSLEALLLLSAWEQFREEPLFWDMYFHAFSWLIRHEQSFRTWNVEPRTLWTPFLLACHVVWWTDQDETKKNCHGKKQSLH